MPPVPRRTTTYMKNRTHAALTLAIAAALLLGASPQPAPAISTADAGRVFAQARALCRADAGKLWGVSLCVPMMLADPTAREAVTNMAVPESTSDGGVFRLTLPASAIISSGPFTYDGKVWAQIGWPMYGSAETHLVTLMHESFHIVQPKLGFKGYAGAGSISGDAFLDTQAGRVWLRAEFHALRAALLAKGDARNRAVRDAIAMRLYRHSLSATTAEQEREQDIMEGLAEGTGIDAGLPPNRRIAYALFDMNFIEDQPSYTRAFGYATGPAYSELLDAVSSNWRRSVTPSSDISRMTARAYQLHVTTPTSSQAQTIIARYGGFAIESQEKARAARIAALTVKYKNELIAGPTIALPMTGFSISFNPRDIEAVDPYGSVYHTLKVTAPWGAITVSGGDAMIDKDFHVLTIAAPPAVSGSAVHGQGWTLTLAPGYAVVPDPKKSGSYIVSAQHS